jgi:hypothetical protein
MRWTASLLMMAPLVLFGADAFAQAWAPPPPPMTAPPGGYGAPPGWYGPPPTPTALAPTPLAPRPAAPEQQPAPPLADAAADGTGLMIGGTLTWALYYGASALSTAALGKACDWQPEAEVPNLDELRESGQLTEEQEQAVSRVTTFCDGAGLKRGYIPFAGPFLTIVSLKETPLSMWPVSVGLASLGVGQITGAVLLLAGMIQHAHAEPAPALQVLPTVGPSSAGMSLSLRF